MFEPAKAAASALAIDSTTGLGPFGSQWVKSMLAACAGVPGCKSTGYLMDGGSAIIEPSG